MKTATKEIWTSGITNIPKNNRDARYTFFELDTKDIDKLHFVLDVYRTNLNSVYVHELLSGYHFFNLQPIDKVAYNRIINLLKFLNPLCPLTVLRIIPNKWNGEQRYWRKGHIEGRNEAEIAELTRLRTSIENQTLYWIEDNFETVRYPYEECPNCGICNTIAYNNILEHFICTKCQTHTIGRVKPKFPPTMTLTETKRISSKIDKEV